MGEKKNETMRLESNQWSNLVDVLATKRVMTGAAKPHSPVPHHGVIHFEFFRPGKSCESPPRWEWLELS